MNRTDISIHFNSIVSIQNGVKWNAIYSTPDILLETLHKSPNQMMWKRCKIWIENDANEANDAQSETFCLPFNSRWVINQHLSLWNVFLFIRFSDVFPSFRISCGWSWTIICYQSILWLSNICLRQIKSRTHILFNRPATLTASHLRFTTSQHPSNL